MSDITPIFAAQMIARNLSEYGFKLVFWLELRRHWPGYPAKNAFRDAIDYIGVPVGTDGYVWSISSAKEAARRYAEEFGEVCAP
ncbi:hypothetical protein ACQZ4Q_08345 [Agrobacterium vitis]